MTSGGTEILAALSGMNLYLKSANGHYWRLAVSDAGAVTAVDVGEDPPADGPTPATPS